MSPETPPPLVDLVFRGRRLPAMAAGAKAWGWSLAIAAHVAAIGWGVEHVPTPGTPTGAAPETVLMQVSPAQVQPPQTPPVQPAPPATATPANEAPPSVAPTKARRRVKAKKVAPAATKDAAQSGAVVTASKEAPVDLTGAAFVTGSAARYAGGVSHAQGTHRRKVNGGAGGPRVRATTGSNENLRRPVRWEGSTQWSCPWPKEAMDQDVYQQEVLLRVRVLADGRVSRVHVHRDPGWGFGDAARRCAKQLKFVPAMDAKGRAIVAMSPPIRVRFRR